MTYCKVSEDKCPNCRCEAYVRGDWFEDGKNLWFSCRCKKCGLHFDNVLKFVYNEATLKDG